MEKISTPAVAKATILAILVLAVCFLFVMAIGSFLSAAVAKIISWQPEKEKRRPPSAVSSPLRFRLHRNLFLRFGFLVGMIDPAAAGSRFTAFGFKACGISRFFI